MSVLAPTAFTFFADLLAQYEGVGSGATWADAFSDPLPIAAILFMLTFDTALYSEPSTLIPLSAQSSAGGLFTIPRLVVFKHECCC